VNASVASISLFIFSPLARAGLPSSDERQMNEGLVEAEIPAR